MEHANNSEYFKKYFIFYIKKRQNKMWNISENIHLSMILLYTPNNSGHRFVSKKIIRLHLKNSNRPWKDRDATTARSNQYYQTFALKLKNLCPKLFSQ